MSEYRRMNMTIRNDSKELKNNKNPSEFNVRIMNKTVGKINRNKSYSLRK